MTRLSHIFSKLKSEGRKALVPYITPEFPVIGVTVPLVLALESAGATMVEIGMPFSDPLADGGTIQHSSHIALQHGVNLQKIFGLVKEIRAQSTVPIILMGYINPILTYGIEHFFRHAHDAGVDGVIIPDLPPEELHVGYGSAQNDGDMADTFGISRVMLIAPTSSDERIRMIDALSSDFSYCVSVTGVTGARQTLLEDASLMNFLQRVERNTQKPFVVGFGISKREHVEFICQYADGAVVGSALIRAVEGLKTVDDVVRVGSAFIAGLKV
jgi:tryptophan synthase alpha chain